MGYFQGEHLVKVTNNISNGLEEAMNLLKDDGGLINIWAFDENGDIMLYQDYSCGCNKLIHKIKLDINKDELDVLQEEEFVLQVEDMLLEANDVKGYNNFLFNITDTSVIINECEYCV